MAYFAAGFVFEEEPQWQRLTDYFPEVVSLTGYRHRTLKVYALDAWRAAAHEHYPFNDELRFDPVDWKLPEETIAVLRRSDAVVEAIGDAGAPVNDGLIAVVAAVSSIAGTRTFFFASSDEDDDLAVVADRGRLLRFRYTTEEIVVDFSDGRMTVSPQVFVEEGEAIEYDIDDELLEEIAKVSGVTIGAPVVTTGGALLHGNAVALWPVSAISPTDLFGLGTFDAFEHVGRDFEVVFTREGVAPGTKRKHAKNGPSAKERPSSVRHRSIMMVVSLVESRQPLEPAIVRPLLGSAIDDACVRQLYRAVEYNSTRPHEEWHDRLAAVVQEHAAAFPPVVARATKKELFDAIRANDRDAVERFLDVASHYAWELDFNDASGRNPLQAAQRGASEEVLDLLTLYVDRGIDFAPYLGFEPEELERRAQRGDVRATFELGRRLVRGEEAEENAALAYPLIRAAADAWHPPAIYLLGLLHQVGAGVPADENRARELFTEAALMGFAPAQQNLADLLLEEDAAEAIYWLESAATRDGSAAFRLSQVYFDGEGVDPWEKRGLEWLQRAAELEHPQALYELGMRYRDGDGVGESVERAFELFELGYQQGHPECAMQAGLALELGRGTEESPGAAMTRYMLASEAGVGDAWYRMGVIEFGGIDGEPDLVKARKYFERAIAEGVVAGKFGLSQLLMTNERATFDDLENAARLLHEVAATGTGAAKISLATAFGDSEFFARAEAKRGGRKPAHWFPASVNEVVSLLESAVEDGDDDAALMLSEWYESGEVVDADEKAAVRWLRVAAQHDSGEAKYRLALRLEKGRGVMANPRAALELYEHAADLGHARAAYAAGRCFRDGTGTEQSLEIARGHFDEAARLGDVRAWADLGAIAEAQKRPEDAVELYETGAGEGSIICAYNLGQMFRWGKGIPKDGDEAAKWYRLAAEGGDVDAMRQLGTLLLESPKRRAEGLRWLQQGAELGDEKCAAALAAARGKK